jgi:hypothetical protein
MFRDKGPIQNIGYGVSSRDMPSKEGETETPSPNSGYIAKALDQHPIMRFLGAAATTMVATTVASRVSRGAGLRLGQSLQSASDKAVGAGRTNATSTRLVKSVRDLREAFDELGGVSRTIDGVDDPYSKVVHEVDGKLTTGYDPKLSGRYFRRPISADGRRTTGRGRTSESAEVWTLRDDIQTRMVSLARRLPYELPAMYATQRAVIDPLFGEDQDKPRLKWYNPADVISDFVKQSTINLTTMMLPFEAIGAAGSAGRSSLTTFASSMEDLRALSPLQRKAANTAIDLRSLLAEVGQDISNITGKALKLSSQTSGAFAAGIGEVKNSQPEFVQSLKAARHGASVAAQEAYNKNPKNRLKVNTARARGFFTGESDDGLGILDTMPGFKGFRSGSVVAKNQFKALGVAHDVVSGRLSEQAALGQIVQKFGYSSRGALDDALSNNALNLKQRGLDATSAENLLQKSINAVQSQHSSKLSKLAQSYHTLGRGGPGPVDLTTGGYSNEAFRGSTFYTGQLKDEYKNQLARHLVKEKGVNETLADRFVANINIDTLPSRRNVSDITNRITLGRKSTFTDDAVDSGAAASDFFDDILEKFRTVRGGKDFQEALGSRKCFS